MCYTQIRMVIIAFTEVQRAREAPRRNTLLSRKKPEIRNGISQLPKVAKINMVNKWIHMLSLVTLVQTTNLLTVILKNRVYDFNTFRP